MLGPLRPRSHQRGNFPKGGDRGRWGEQEQSVEMMSMREEAQISIPEGAARGEGSVLYVTPWFHLGQSTSLVNTCGLNFCCVLGMSQPRQSWMLLAVLSFPLQLSPTLTNIFHLHKSYNQKHTGISIPSWPNISGCLLFSASALAKLGGAMREIWNER